MKAAEKVRAAREGLHMSRYEFAEMLGIGKSTIYRWEAGKARPRVSHSERIAARTGKPRCYYHLDDWEDQ